MFAKIEPGTISQFSVYTVVLFSFLLMTWKRLLAALVFVTTLGILIHSAYAYAAMGGPGVCGTMCMANRNYYGSPYGGYGFYPYQGPPYHSLYGPTPYYFSPYGPSPYQPYNCVACMQRYQQFTSPMNFPGMTKWTIPMQAPTLVQVDD